MKNYIKTPVLKLKFLICIIFISASSFAQVQVPGSSHFFIGYGFPALGPDALKLMGGGKISSSLGPFMAAYQYAVNEKLAVGIMAQYASATSTTVKWTDFLNQTFDYTWSLSILTITAKVDFHYLRARKFDFYSGFAFGIGRATAVQNGEINPDVQNQAVNQVGYAVNALGLRYMPLRHLGFFLEAGYGNVSMVTVGLSSILGNNRKWYEY